MQGEAKIYVEEAPKFRLGEEIFGPFKNQTVNLPLSAALTDRDVDDVIADLASSLEELEDEDEDEDDDDDDGRAFIGMSSPSSAPL